jgi:anti-sigma-K factor RskA
VQAPLVAVMVLDSGQPAFVATFDRASGTMVVTPVSTWADAGRVPELWLIPKGDKPHSLGVVDTTRPITVTVPANLRGAIDPASIVAISVEPAGGSPTGQPTGPVVAKGGISTI